MICIYLIFNLCYVVKQLYLNLKNYQVSKKNVCGQFQAGHKANQLAKFLHIKKLALAGQFQHTVGTPKSSFHADPLLSASSMSLPVWENIPSQPCCYFPPLGGPTLTLFVADLSKRGHLTVL